jgi:hypothetical protein
MIAYAFLQYRRLKAAKRVKKNQRSAASTDLASRPPSYPRTHRATATTAAVPTLPEMDLRRTAACARVYCIETDQYLGSRAASHS